MHEYIVTLNADTGPWRVKTWASSWAAAVGIVLKFECAPVSSVLSVEEWA